METNIELINAIREMEKSRKLLAKQYLKSLQSDVTFIIETQSHDQNRIEHLLDNLLNYCFDADILLEFKRLLRYYLPIDPESVISYVNFYRDEYDVDYQEDMN
jgi:hypothetical protein